MITTSSLSCYGLSIGIISNLSSDLIVRKGERTVSAELENIGIQPEVLVLLAKNKYLAIVLTLITGYALIMNAREKQWRHRRRKKRIRW
jgi:hypothetical protein